MKLAETLTQIKDIKGKIADLQAKVQRKLTVVKLKEDQPMPDHNVAIREIKALSDKLAGLKSRIVATNVKHGLIQKINQLQEAKFMVSFLDGLSRTEQKDVQLHGGGYGQAQKECEVHATFDVENVKKLLAAHQKTLRDLDLELQRQNWLVDIVD